MSCLCFFDDDGSPWDLGLIIHIHIHSSCYINPCCGVHTMPSPFVGNSRVWMTRDLALAYFPLTSHLNRLSSPFSITSQSPLSFSSSLLSTFLRAFQYDFLHPRNLIIIHQDHHLPVLPCFLCHHIGASSLFPFHSSTVFYLPHHLSLC